MEHGAADDAQLGVVRAQGPHGAVLGGVEAIFSDILVDTAAGPQATAHIRLDACLFQLAQNVVDGAVRVAGHHELLATRHENAHGQAQCARLARARHAT